MSFSGFGT